MSETETYGSIRQGIDNISQNMYYSKSKYPKMMFSILDLTLHLRSRQTKYFCKHSGMSQEDCQREIVSLQVCMYVTCIWKIFRKHRYHMQC